jgi:hypothetical protein
VLPSIDTYLYSEIEGKLEIILSNRYIIEEILKDIQPKISKNFIRAYFGEKGREIPIVYTMPQEKVTQQGAIYIGLREGEESSPSLGNIEDTYDFKEQGFVKDLAVVEPTPEMDRLYLEVDQEIGELFNVENLAFSKSDNVSIEDNRIYFAYDESLVGAEFKVNYTATNGSKEKGLQKGFTTKEHYSVLAISTNMDTVRCLDIIIKAIFILMRDNPKEKNNHLLQRLQFGQIEEIDTGRSASEGVPELLYGRETIVTYTSSYSLDVPLLSQFEEIIVNTKPGGE